MLVYGMDLLSAKCHVRSVSMQVTQLNIVLHMTVKVNQSVIVPQALVKLCVDRSIILGGQAIAEAMAASESLVCRSSGLKKTLIMAINGNC
jgi:hypothetical protein